MVYTPTVTNPIHFLAVTVLRRALSSMVQGPGLSERFRKALNAQTMPRDAPVLDAAVRALQATGYSPDDFEGNGGFNNLSAAVQQAIVLLESGNAL